MPVSLADRLQHPQDEGVQVVPEVRNCNVSMAHLYAHLQIDEYTFITLQTCADKSYLGWVKHLK